MFRQRDRSEYVNIEDIHLQRRIAEAEYQEQIQSGSQILRVSGKVRKPDAPPIKAIVVRERG